jgi:hypothetical protein
MTGDSAAADRAMGEAQDLAGTFAGRPQDRRPWSYWITPAYVANQAGITCAHLASDPRWHARAVTLLDTAEDTTGVWAPAQNLAYLAFAHAKAGEVDHACAAGLQASRAVKRARSARNAETLAQVHADLAARHPGDPRVAELADALA